MDRKQGSGRTLVGKTARMIALTGVSAAIAIGGTVAGAGTASADSQQNVVTGTGNKVTPDQTIGKFTTNLSQNLGKFGTDLLINTGTVGSNAQQGLGTVGTNALVNGGTFTGNLLKNTGKFGGNLLKNIGKVLSGG